MYTTKFNATVDAFNVTMPPCDDVNTTVSDFNAIQNVTITLSDFDVITNTSDTVDATKNPSAFQLSNGHALLLCFMAGFFIGGGFLMRVDGWIQKKRFGRLFLGVCTLIFFIIGTPFLFWYLPNPLLKQATKAEFIEACIAIGIGGFVSSFTAAAIFLSLLESKYLATRYVAYGVTTVLATMLMHLQLKPPLEDVLYFATGVAFMAFLVEVGVRLYKKKEAQQNDRATHAEDNTPTTTAPAMELNTAPQVPTAPAQRPCCPHVCTSQVDIDDE
uniref:DUF4203 domain-containing protein n=1 Tax=Panagrellus redivivus TaxID=6233 RepID=A0A7E4VPM6_PANRE